MARNHIKSEFRTSKMADWSEMARNAIKGDFRTSKMVAGKKKYVSIQNVRRRPFCQQFPRKLKFYIDLKWPEMRSKVNFGHPKWPTAAILSKKFKKKINGRRQPFCENFTKIKIVILTMHTHKHPLCCGVGKIDSLENTMFPCMVCLLQQ